MENFSQLLATISSLRGPDGCPWDRKQTPSTLTKYIKEECQELLDAIENCDIDNTKEELGDLLYLILMVSHYYEQQQEFTVDDVMKTVTDKLVRRHPHVFGDSKASSDKELKEQWEAIKAKEKQKFKN